MYKLKNVLIKELLEKNKNTINELKNTIDGEFCFILGAGVSISMGLPDWSRLLAQMIGKLLYTYNGYKPKSDTLSKMYNLAMNREKGKFCKGSEGEYVDYLKNINLLEVAEYILNYHFDMLPHENASLKKGVAEKQLVSLVQSCIYKRKKELENMYDSKYEKSTMQALVRIIQNLYGKKKEKQQIITYNYDNLLEYCLLKDQEMSIIQADDIKSIAFTDYDKKLEDHKINICHIHGMVNVSDLDKMSKKLILSESSYHDIEAEEYKWIHTVQATAMANNTCVFVGFSAEDYNFRRIARKNEKTNQSYIIFAVNDFVTAIFGEYVDSESKKQKKDKSQIYEELFQNEAQCRYEKLMLTFLIDSKTRYWEKQNIIPIWTTLDELPEIISSLKDSAS